MSRKSLRAEAVPTVRMKLRTLWFVVLSVLALALVAHAQTSYHINNPEVRQHVTKYRNITFSEGDLVYVSAGGCVQTGGSGRTWKRYVDPRGDNAERLYHGLIWIPGATAGLETIAGVINRSPLVIPALAPGADPAQMFLRLGYDDDNYDDNGYWGHDDGQYDQCRYDFGAWVDINIDHRGAPVPAPTCPSSQYPIDLYWGQGQLDPNMLPMTPRWGQQCNHNPAQPVDAYSHCRYFREFEDHTWNLGYYCTRSVPTADSRDVPAVCLPFGDCLCRSEQSDINGHVNFGFGTLRGRLFWSGQERCDLFGDCDVNLDMLTYNGELASYFNHRIENQNSVLLEFDASETLGRSTSPWWFGVFNPVAILQGSRERAFNGKHAIAIGLIGFDTVHDGHTELHPVLGLAMRLTDTPGEEVWVVMARRSGNEGECGQLQHNVELDEMRFLLDSSAYSIPRVAPGTTFANGASMLISPRDYRVEFTPAGTLLSISLPPPGQVVMGELHIRQCVPRTCGSACGVIGDGCGGILDCGECNPSCFPLCGVWPNCDSCPPPLDCLCGGRWPFCSDCIPERNGVKS